MTAVEVDLRPSGRPQVTDVVETLVGQEPWIAPTVEIVIPVYNEQAGLAPAVRRLVAFLTEGFGYSHLITIADNASTDGTWELASRLATELPGVRAVRLSAKGRGLALRTAWSLSSAPVVAYMDVDLSTDLRALLPLVAPIISGHSDIAIGTRLSRGSRVVRGPKRELISRGYNLVLRGTLGASFSDAQCGFKALSRAAVDRLLPLVENNNWFFDTELLVLAQRSGLRIHEVPVDWTDDPDSRVDLVATIKEDLAGVVRLSRGLITGRIPIDRLRTELASGPDAATAVPGVPKGLLGQLLRFGGIGVLSTLAYFALFLGLREITGPQVANLAALIITAVANTAANRRLTFGVTGSADLIKHQVGGLIAFVVALGLTSGSLWALHSLDPTPNRAIELGVLVLANVVATGVRFLSLRQLMGRRTRAG